ncbi:D-alanyl-D-alanine carboxypeptidase/D-alanyl-D-alanine-endopeptidase [Kocuria tytonicola]|uniref:D-alanyl-D-alanine carboxypeptidase/D-alanyl-D-alanine-endopeptidase n=1 Tax=Kocuria tytonicola TaxID=2055946 RepID=A0A3L9L0Q8_9MICC|nr:D-alanyl-D-alanine carboxypeptidase/D-alanyl-D-alanine-endopeptidase [Kocuria tytonicola]RLY91684.1 D-alanyl-D-alanine carboxypeptidase/D-alanyl-D-alanine-endopeptidase [Kocuria tytonicola]
MPQTSPSPPRRSGWSLVCAVLAVVLGIAAALVAPGVLAEIRPALAGARTEAAASPAATGSTAAVPASPSAPVSTDAVERALRSGLDGAPGTTAAVVTEAGADRVLAGEAQTRPVVPASNQKLLTALSLAEHVGPYERLATRVVVGEAPGELTLVAGGDTLLAPGEGNPEQVNGRAGLGTLAQRTARALRERSPDAASGPVSVAVDTSLFTGPDTNPAWDPEDLESGEITRVAPIALYSHRVPTGDGGDPGGRGDRPGDPAGAAVAEFAHRLGEELGGTEVTVRATSRAPEDATELARVESAPVHEQSAYMLAHSDNSLAETLARVAASRSGREAGVDGVRELLPATLREHGIDTTGLRVLDASGMAAADRVTATTLAETVNSLISEPRCGPYGRGLPVAGGAGTLSERFDDPPEDPARGIARAKTGTLLDVVALTGYVQRADGRVLVYSIVLNGVSGHADEAKDRVDRTVAELARSA